MGVAQTDGVRDQPGEWQILAGAIVAFWWFC